MSEPKPKAPCENDSQILTFYLGGAMIRQMFVTIIFSWLKKLRIAMMLEFPRNSDFVYFS